MLLFGKQNSEHFSGKLVSFWGGGGKAPQIPHRGSAPGHRWGLRPADPLWFVPPGTYS